MTRTVRSVWTATYAKRIGDPPIDSFDVLAEGIKDAMRAAYAEVDHRNSGDPRRYPVISVVYKGEVIEVGDE